MEISFHGAARTVTGSKHLLKLKSGTTVLLDCGMFQGHPKEADALNREWGFDPAEIDYLILSHAHIDHSGLIPKLVKDGYKGSVFCTPATLDLCEIMLKDSAHIQESDVRHINKRKIRQGKEPVEPLYSLDDATIALERFVTFEYNVWTKINDEVELLFTDAGHIIGSASVNLKIKEDDKITRLTFSGDIGRFSDEILNPPQAFPQADVIICESTYGDRLHTTAEAITNQLLEIIVDTCVRKKGNLIIPAFSVGRTQEIVYALNRLDIEKRLPNIEFYVDSPLSVEATNVVKSHKECFNQKLLKYMEKDPYPFEFKQLHFIKEVSESKALEFNKNPKVIISSSGMADAGRVKHHLAHNIEKKSTTVLMIGYCEPNSLVARLKNGVKDITIFGEPLHVNAEIKELNSLSAHGDYDDILHYLSCQNPNEVKHFFLVHGEYDSQQSLYTKLKNNQYNNIDIPYQHQTFTI